MRFLYNLLTYLLLIPFAFYWLIRGIGNRAYLDRLGQRFGFGFPRLDGCIWVHAVSVGEVQAAVPLIRALLSPLSGSDAAGDHRDTNRGCASQSHFRRYSSALLHSVRVSKRNQEFFFPRPPSRRDDHGNGDLAKPLSCLRCPKHSLDSGQCSHFT